MSWNFSPEKDSIVQLSLCFNCKRQTDFANFVCIISSWLCKMHVMLHNINMVEIQK